MEPEAALHRGDLQSRDMQTSDLGQVLQIERDVQVMPWNRLGFEQALNADNVCRVIEHNDTVIAYHVCAEVVDELHILTLAVTARHQGRGLGHLLLEDILSLAKDQKLNKLFLEVRESNQVAFDLYQKWEFEQIAIRRNYYRLPDSTDKEHALVMVMLRSLNGKLPKVDSV